jgi:hypothetical protein
MFDRSCLVALGLMASDLNLIIIVPGMDLDLTPDGAH